MDSLVIKDLEKKFGDVEVLKKINLNVEEGEFVSLLGPSGCGKTTTLRIIAGLLEKSSGEVVINGNNVENVPVHKRNNGMVFQNYALFPNMTVAQNVEYGLKQQKVSREERKKKVKEGLELVHLEWLGDRYPKQLSGGQQQRVALARALVLKPNLLLLDEPLSNLDAKLREEMQVEIRNIQKKLNVTTIFVTHDQKEALSMSDKIAVMNKGMIEQYGTPEDIYENPKTEFVATFLGYSNLIRGTVEGQEGDMLIVSSNFGQIRMPKKEGLSKGSRILASVRPERMTLSKTEQEGNSVGCQVTERVYVGNSIQYTVNTDTNVNVLITVSAPDESNNLFVGEKGYISWLPEYMRQIEGEKNA